MRIKFIQIFALVITFTLLNVDVQAQKKKKKKKNDTKITEEVVLANQIDSVSYAIGVNMGQSIKNDFSEGNTDYLLLGLKATIEDTNFAIPSEKIQQVIATYFQAKQAKVAAEQEKTHAHDDAEGLKIKADGVKFLAENKTKEGVVSTASGLQYIIMKAGTGKQPTATSNVTVHYHGTLPDGTVFESTVEKNQPATFGLNQVIKGWTEGVALMKEGAKYRFFIPQELAYGAHPRAGGMIKPYMALVFEIELIKINE